MKVIIDIPEDYYEIIKYDVNNHLTHYRPFEIIANGTPLDDVKAEIIYYNDKHCNSEFISVGTVFAIIDKHIGKAESEDI